MKAPDKIYAGIYPVDNELRQEWSSAPMYGVETTEYIRKESLLDWMSSKMKIVEMIIGTGDELHGYMEAMNDLFNKLKQ